MKHAESKTKNPLYTGDPNATYTMCPKKLRRHFPRDFASRMEPTVDAATGNVVGHRILTWCKHCKQNPLLEAHAQT